VNTILVGYDGSRAAEQALGRVAELARALDSKVVVVSVAAPAPAGAYGLVPYVYVPSESELESDEAVQHDRREHVRAFFAGRGLGVEFEGVTGPPAEEILELADRHRADLIVVGTREAGLLERLLGGSVSQCIARKAHCDVLVVHAHED
jgi:nucleotide-binding universal stress UspA family protein